MERLTVYKTSDGKIFDKEFKALAHEKALALKPEIEKLFQDAGIKYKIDSPFGKAIVTAIAMWEAMKNG